MWNDIQPEQTTKESNSSLKSKKAKKRKRYQDVYKEENEDLGTLNQDDDDDGEEDEPRQSFIFSATLTLAEDDRQLVILNRKQQKMERKWKKSGGQKKVNNESVLMKIMKKIGLRGDPFIADLTVANSLADSTTTSINQDESSTQVAKVVPSSSSSFKVAVPNTLSLYHAEVLQLSKDSYLYHFLLQQQSHFATASLEARKQMINLSSSSSETKSETTASEEANGTYESQRGLRIIVFVNAIAAARRLSATLALLEMDSICIHAEMQQRQRLKQLDKFKSVNEKHMVLVATDVAARGLDIPNVNAVVHYDLPRTADAFIHRSGRSARAGTSGVALSLISESQIKAYAKIMEVVVGPRFAAKFGMKEAAKKIEELEAGVVDMVSPSVNQTHVKPCAFPHDANLLKRASERAHVAGKIVKIEDGAGRDAASNNWYRVQAKAMEIDLDENIEEQEMKSDEGSERELRRLKQSLQSLLSTPLNGKKVASKRIKKSGTSITNQQPRRKNKKK